MTDKEASNIDFDALAYAAIEGYSYEHFELRPGLKGERDPDFANAKIDGWTAFTMVHHWPKIRLVIDFDKEGGDDVEWFLERVSDADNRVAIITFYSKPQALVDAELAKIRDHAKKKGNAKELKGLTPYQRVGRMIGDYDRHRKSAAEQSRIEKQEADRLARKAAKYPPKKGSDEQRVMLTATKAHGKSRSNIARQAIFPRASMPTHRPRPCSQSSRTLTLCLSCMRCADGMAARNCPTGPWLSARSFAAMTMNSNTRATPILPSPRPS